MPGDRDSLDAREARLAEAEEQLARDRAALDIEKESVKKQGWRDNLYGRINVSVKTMDRVIWVIGGLLVIALIVGIVMK